MSAVINTNLEDKTKIASDDSVETFAEMLATELGYAGSSTYVSTPVTFIDLDEVNSITSEFFYNYYTKDERTVSTGKSTIIDISSNDQDVEFIKNQSRMPRSVLLKIKSREKQAFGETSYLGNFANSNINGRFISNNIDKIVFEGAVANSRFSTVILKDNQIDETFYNQITGSIAFDDSFSKTDTNSQFVNDLCEKYFSPTAEATQSPSTIRRAFSNLQPAGVAYAPTDARLESITEAMRDVRFVEIGFSINHAVINNMILGSVEDMGNIYQDELLSLADNAKAIQQKYVSEMSPSVIDSADFEMEMAPIYTVTVDQAESQGLNVNESSYPIGFYIEKVEFFTDENGIMTSRNMDPIVVDSYGSFTILDSDIKYGATYVYNTKIIYLTAYEATAIDPSGDSPDEVVFAISMVASEGKKTQVACLENIPPNPPQNLRFNYNFMSNCLDIFWEEPVNPQRDVVRYQIFRRKNTSQSFVLLCELDFDNSTSRVVPLETAPEDKIIRVTGPRKLFRDKSFEKDSDYIYALACVDARGLTSSYSEQVKVRFNRFKNKIERQRISAPGAPKPYPNLYLKRDLFVDSMNSSGARRMRVFFDPEYADLVRTVIQDAGDGSQNNVDSSLDLISNNYKIQMINLDLQNSQVFNIDIIDNTGPALEVPVTSATIKSIL